MFQYILIFSLITHCCSHVLVLHPTMSGSHEHVLREISHHLAAHHYRVTHVRCKTVDKQSPSSHPAIRTITLSLKPNRYTQRYILPDGAFQFPDGILFNSKRSYFDFPLGLEAVTEVFCEAMLEKKLIEYLSTQNLTVAIVDLLTNACGVALAKHLGLPVLGFWGGIPNALEADIVSGFLPPSVKKNYMSEVEELDLFWSRLWNVYTCLLDTIMTEYNLYECDRAIQRLLPGSPSSKALLLDVNAFLVVSHPVVDHATFHSPQEVPLGCVSCHRSIRPLSQDLDEWSKDGAVLFSLGLTFHGVGGTVPYHHTVKIMKAFTLLPYKVIMAFNATLIGDVPSNVLLLDRIPQLDLLGSGRIVAFVSHCGINSLMEAIYHRVPVVGMPVFADQGDNAITMVTRGMAVMVDRDRDSAETIAKAIMQVATNQSFREAVNKYSYIMRMESQSGVDKALYWTRMVEKFGDLRHLKATTRSLSVFQHLMLDVIGFCLGVFFLAVITLVYVCKTFYWFLRKIRRKFIITKKKNM